jgi:hypothetical protein
MTTSIGDLIWGVAFSSATACSAAQRSGHWSLMHLGRVNGSRLFVGSRVRWGVEKPALIWGLFWIGCIALATVLSVLLCETGHGRQKSSGLAT